MRHVELKERGKLDLVDVAAIWPAAGPLAEVEAGLETRATPAVPDMPPAIGRAIVAVYAALVGVFFVTMASGAEATFMIAISALYVAIFLAVPRIFLKVENDRSVRPDLGRFMEKGIDTWTGHMSGSSALVQIFVVPVLLTLGMLVIGIAARWYLP
jgi:hypothetical protein